jgi:hypothetical protein
MERKKKEKAESGELRARSKQDGVGFVFALRSLLSALRFFRGGVIL